MRSQPKGSERQRHFKRQQKQRDCQYPLPEGNLQPERCGRLEVRNESISGKTLLQIKDFLGRPFVCSRIRHEGHVSIPNHETIFHVGDQLFIVCSEEDAEAVTAFIGKEIHVDWEKQDTPMVSRRILVTKSEINGKKLGSLHFRSMYGVNVTRINRSGMDLFADPNLVLQVGDRLLHRRHLSRRKHLG